MQNKSSFFQLLKQATDTGTLSIKKLTLLGFTLVALPLVLALIYSGVQVNKISKQGTQAVFSVAALTTANRELNESQLSLERFASQYLVLKDHELKTRFLILEKQLVELITSELKSYNHEQLSALCVSYIEILTDIRQLISIDNVDESALDTLQDRFVALASISQKINLRSSEIINAQAVQIKTTAEQVSRTMLISLLIIPVTLVIAGVFIYLITTPLKLLIKKIQSLEHGDFDKEIVIMGSPEIREIADALEIMRRRLHALELQKSSFIRHISHELKTPLAAIREGTELLYDNSVGKLNAEQTEICHIIKNSVNRLQRLIEDLLDFNIVLDSTSLQDSEKIALKPLLTNVIADHKLDIKRKQLTIEQSTENIYLHSNIKQLKVILDNILSNAIKYSNEKGVISVSASIIQDSLNLTISDQGPGIANNIQSKIFDAFYQGPAPKDHQIKGSGLGLTIVKELLMRLNGEITVTPFDPKNVGTSIQITLPRAMKLGSKT